ncbi:MAG TPA: VanZ family protein, partial [Methylomirabilota bacterium]|nr:VanZ family protein [Methylomirabilota bacterium]
MAIVAITATPTGSTRIEAPLWCLACAAFGQRAAVDLLLNVALYVPLGLGLRLMGLSWRAAVSIAFGVTLTIELLQMRIIAGRFASVGDVFANTLGSWAGAVVAPRWRAFLLPDARLARHLTALGAVAWLALLVGTVAGLQPTAPGGEYRARFGRDRRHDDSFAGRVLSASLNGRPLPGGPLAESETLRRHLRDGGALVEVVVFTTGEPRDRTPILTLGAKGQRILVLAQDGHDVVL